MATDHACRRLSKDMVKLLRHDARRKGVQINSEGFVNLKVALQACDVSSAGLPDLYQRWREIVAEQSRKQRFEQVVRDGITYVRARQGHTDRSLDPAKMYQNQQLDDKVEVGYHGTAWRYVEKIRREGLHAKKRVGVHFYRDRTALVQNNQPDKREVVVVVNVRRAAAAGLRFWDTTGVSFLGPRHVPACFIDQIVSADGTDTTVERGGCVKGSWKGAGEELARSWKGAGKELDRTVWKGGGQKGMGYGYSHDKGGRSVGDEYTDGANTREPEHEPGRYGWHSSNERQGGWRVTTAWPPRAVRGPVPRGGGRDGADCAPHGDGYSTGGRGEADREKYGEPGAGWACVVADLVWTRPCHDKRTLKDAQYALICTAYVGEKQQYEISDGLRGNLYSLSGSPIYFRYYQCIDGQWVEGRLSVHRFLDGRNFEDVIAAVDRWGQTSSLGSAVYPLAVYEF